MPTNSTSPRPAKTIWPSTPACCPSSRPLCSSSRPSPRRRPRAPRPPAATRSSPSTTSSPRAATPNARTWPPAPHCASGARCCAANSNAPTATWPPPSPPPRPRPPTPSNNCWSRRRSEVALLQVAGHIDLERTPLPIPDAALSAHEPHTADRLKSLAALPYRLSVVRADIERPRNRRSALHPAQHRQRQRPESAVALGQPTPAPPQPVQAELADTITTIGHAHRQVSEQQWALPPGAIVVIDDPAAAEPDQLADIARHAATADARVILLDPATSHGASSSGAAAAHSLPAVEHHPDNAHCRARRSSAWRRPRRSPWPTASAAPASANRGDNCSPSTTPLLAPSAPPSAATSPWDGAPPTSRSRNPTTPSAPASTTNSPAQSGSGGGLPRAPPATMTS